MKLHRHSRPLLPVFGFALLAGVVQAQSEELEPIAVAADISEGAAAVNAENFPGGEEVAADDDSGDGADVETKRLRQERDRLAAENALAQERLRQELFDLQAEKQRLALENSLRTERLNLEAAEAKTKLDRLNLEIETVTKEASLEQARRRAELEKELGGLKAEDERLKVANSVASQKMEAQLAEMRLREAQYKTEKAQLEIELAQLQSQLSVREKSEILRDLAPPERRYTLEPFSDGVLQISDRRIAMNNVVTNNVANHIAQRIDYFNNQNTEFPIFLVIDTSPGGAVMAGYKVLKAMEGSQAPVYVVVKSYAASMSAVIATTAEKSFAYPNAVIVHHQMGWFGQGNLTQQREQLEEAQQWWRRLALPVAEKMGLTLDEFIRRMYEENSDGNWSEFADAAVELHWIDQTVDTIWDTSMDRNPDRFGERPIVGLALDEKIDSEGNPYVVLPRLSPFDAYFIYNPGRYYRLP